MYGNILLHASTIQDGASELTHTSEGIYNMVDKGSISLSHAAEPLPRLNLNVGRFEKFNSCLTFAI